MPPTRHPLRSRPIASSLKPGHSGLSRPRWPPSRRRHRSRPTVWLLSPGHLHQRLRHSRRIRRPPLNPRTGWWWSPGPVRFVQKHPRWRSRLPRLSQRTELSWILAQRWCCSDRPLMHWLRPNRGRSHGPRSCYSARPPRPRRNRARSHARRSSCLPPPLTLPPNCGRFPQPSYRYRPHPHLRRHCSDACQRSSRRWSARSSRDHHCGCHAHRHRVHRRLRHPRR
jgi:hypothetical protein